VRPLVAGLPQQFREGFLAAVEAATVVPEPVEMAVQAGKHHGPAGPANGIGHKAVSEEGAFPRDTIDIGRGCKRGQPAAVSADGILGMVIRINPEDVRALLPVCVMLHAGEGCGCGG